MNVTYSECVFAGLSIQHEMRMRLFFICVLSSSTIFFQIISQKARFSGVLSFSETFVENTSHYKNNSARYDHKCTSVFLPSTGYSCQILMKLEFVSTNVMVAPCINIIKHFIVQLMHTNYKILRLLK